MDRHIADMPRLVPQLRGTIMLPGRGHITQEERAAEVSAEMIDVIRLSFELGRSRPPQQKSASPADVETRSRCTKLRHRAAGNFEEYLRLMRSARATTVEGGITRGSWSEIFRNGLGLYSALVIGGIAMNATQMFVIAIIMPTFVRDIGGANFYTWAAMLYTIGAIVGGASTGTVWSRLGARRAYTLGAGVFAFGTVCCALAPDIGSLIAARGVQGWAGGLVSGSGMAPIASLFDARLRTRIIAISQGTFTACHLSGPIVGGMFAAMQGGAARFG